MSGATTNPTFSWFEDSGREVQSPDRYPLFDGDPFREAQRALSGLLLASGSAQRGAEPPSLEDTAIGARLLTEEGDFQSRVTLAAVVRLIWNDARKGGAARRFSAVLRGLLGRFLRRRLPCEASELGLILSLVAVQPPKRAASWPLGSLVRWAEWSAEGSEPDPALRAGLIVLLESGVLGVGRAEHRALARRIERLVGLATEDDKLLDPDEPWAQAALADIEKMGGDLSEAWEALLEHAGKIKGAQPSARWQSKAQALAEPLGAEEIQARFESWTTHFGKGRTAPDPRTTEVLRGLVWTASLTASGESTARVLGELAETSFRKLPEVGARSTRLGNACLETLSRLEEHGLGRLIWLRRRLKVPSAQQRIARALEAESERQGIALDDLEELATPDGGLDARGIRTFPIGRFIARIALGGPTQVDLDWIRPDGRPQKSVPTEVRKVYPEELSQVRALAREIQAVLAAERDRLEGLWLTDRFWCLEDWRTRIVGHRLRAHLAEGLIWQFQRGPRSQTGMLDKGEVVDAEGRALDWIDARATVHLWHPADSSLSVRQAWQRSLLDRGVTQPFKQAHRELYPPTEAERGDDTATDRFEGHALKQHQLSALCKQRGWRYHLQGLGFGGRVAPQLDIPSWGLEAELNVDPIDRKGAVADSGIALFVRSGFVRFKNHEGKAVAMGKVPPRVFSEVMRAVDLFVSVCSAGQGKDADKDALGVTARARRAVLRQMMPHLPISPRCRLEDRFLKVRGQRFIWRIHLGSGHVYKDQTGEEIVLQPDQIEPAPVAVPYEGDRTLALILARAWALSNDSEIDHPAISPPVEAQTSLAFF